MPLQELDIEADLTPMTAGVEALIDEAGGRIDDFLESRRGPVVSPFLPSDFRLVYGVLSQIARRKLAMGGEFCEWGSGFGVVTCLASLLGFDACGIEYERQLVEEAEELARLFDIKAEFWCGNYLPAGFDYFTDSIAGSHQLMRNPTHGAPVGWYEGLDAGVEDFDVIFAYPWPKEEQLLEELFDSTASEGALYVTYHGVEDVRVRRKVK